MDIAPNTPKGCLICGLVDSLGVAYTCPGCGEATWSATAPSALPASALAPAPAPDPLDPPVSAKKFKGAK